jgi:hypothetical protein
MSLESREKSVYRQPRAVLQSFRILFATSCRQCFSIHQQIPPRLWSRLVLQMLSDLCWVRHYGNANLAFRIAGLDVRDINRIVDAIGAELWVRTLTKILSTRQQNERNVGVKSFVLCLFFQRALKKHKLAKYHLNVPNLFQTAFYCCPRLFFCTNCVVATCILFVTRWRGFYEHL